MWYGNEIGTDRRTQPIFTTYQPRIQKITRIKRIIFYFFFASSSLVEASSHHVVFQVRSQAPAVGGSSRGDVSISLDPRYERIDDAMTHFFTASFVIPLSHKAACLSKSTSCHWLRRLSDTRLSLVCGFLAPHSSCIVIIWLILGSGHAFIHYPIVVRHHRVPHLYSINLNNHEPLFISSFFATLGIIVDELSPIINAFKISSNRIGLILERHTNQWLSSSKILVLDSSMEGFFILQ